MLSLLTQMMPIALSEPTQHVRFGGELRERAEFVSATSIAAGADNADGYLLQRALLHADMQWSNVRIFAQLGSSDEFGREPAAKPTDVDYLDTRQLFVEAPFDAGSVKITLRAGRQEMSYGASRLISVRDGPNIRLAFDGVRFDVTGSAWNTTLFAVRPAENTPGDFDDGTLHDQSLMGLYARYRASPSWQSDIYYFDSHMDDMQFDSIAADEHRQTIGARVYGKRDAWDSDIELMLQYGSIGDLDIRAFALATDNGFTFVHAPWAPRIGVRTDFISGDRDADDGHLGTFNALYPNGAYFSEAGILAQANLLDLALSLTLKPRADLSLSWALNPLWRYSTDDALYRLPLAPQIAGTSSGERYIGVQNQLMAIWSVNSQITLRFAAVTFNAGDFVREADGNDLNYGQLAVQLRF